MEMCGWISCHLAVILCIYIYISGSALIVIVVRSSTELLTPLSFTLHYSLFAF